MYHYMYHLIFLKLIIVYKIITYDFSSIDATTKILSEVIHRNLKKPLNSMFKGFFIGCIVRCCPKRFDPIFALCG